MAPTTFMDQTCSRLFENVSAANRQNVCERWFKDMLEHCSTMTLFRRGIDEVLFTFYDLIAVTINFVVGNTHTTDYRTQLTDKTCRSLMINTVEDYIQVVPMYNEVVEQNFWLWIGLCGVIASVGWSIGRLHGTQKSGHDDHIVPTVVFKGADQELAEDPVTNYETVIEKLKFLFQRGAQCRVTIDFGMDHRSEVGSETTEVSVLPKIDDVARRSPRNRTKKSTVLSTRARWRL